MLRILGLALVLSGCADGGESLRRAIANMDPPRIEAPRQPTQVNCTSQSYDGRTVQTTCQQQP